MRSKLKTADICLVLEGTYPYVAGGVSTWVHQIVSAFSDVNFAIFHIGAQKSAAGRRKYAVPENVIHFEDAFLFEKPSALVQLRDTVPASWSPFYASLRKLCLRIPAGDLHDLELLRGLMEQVARHPAVSFDTFWQDRETWAVIREVYERFAPGQAFLDFYWTACFLVQPLWNLARSLPRIPRAAMYHTACTGYAGLAAAIAASANQAPLLLTEHGIYIRERISDISRSPWLPDRPAAFPGLADPLNLLKRLWIGFFDIAGRMCYHKARDIVSLFEKNAAAQRHFGADGGKITIIPNGIKAEECVSWHEERAARRKANPRSQVAGFLGRIVSIKDVKTLIHAARKVCDALPDARFIIAGPGEEEPEYHRECLALVQQLGLGGQIQFTGAMERGKFFPQIDIMLLTSISEGLPFVVIESLASGVPVISTDVGACAEMLHGRPDARPPIGPAGLVAEAGNAAAIAAAAIRLLTDEPLLDELSANGRELAARCYHEDSVLAEYRRLYGERAVIGRERATTRAEDSQTADSRR